MDMPTWQRSTDYTLAKSGLGVWTNVYGTVLGGVALVFVMPWAYGAWVGGAETGPWREALALVAILILLGLPDLPFEWFNQFRLEARFGFNKSSIGLWVTDKIKGLILGFVLMMVLIGGLLWLYDILREALPKIWWLVAFGAFFAVQLVMMVLWPILILPLFNKLTPLPEGELKERLMALGERTGFAAKTIEVIDGSKRSGHSNAFFTGFGRFRRIVLFDTLIEQMSTEELEAILAHEIGHYKCGHIPKSLALSAVMGAGAFWFISFLTQSTWFYEHLGFGAESQGRLGPVLLILSVAAGAFTYWFSPLSNILSRKNEYEADAFAKNAVGGPHELCSALRKLHVENLSHPLPHPLYATVYYSHPSLLEREGALLKK
jgi:STE24 endopeptidase